MNLDTAKAGFVAESRELIAEMEAALLTCESGTADPAKINAIFRAAHTIKGNAGLFGFDAIVAFTHVVESALDQIRDGKIVFDGEWATLLLECRDHMQALIDAVADNVDVTAPQLTVWGKELVTRIAALGALATAAGRPAGDCDSLLREAADCIRTLLEEAPGALNHAPAEELLKRIEQIAKPDRKASMPKGEAVRNPSWHVSVRFDSDVLQYGLDPATFMRFLAGECTIEQLVLVTDALPSPEDYDPQGHYLGYEFRVAPSAQREQIEGAFQFVRDHCRLHVLEPHAALSDYAKLLAELPGGLERAARLIMAVGSLDAAEVERLHTSSAATPMKPGAPAAAVEREASKSAEQQSIRVDATKLERLLNLVGELVTASASAELMAQRTRNADMNEAALRFSRLVQEVRDEALTLRMMPIGTTFARFTRIVRDMSRELGKEIRLETSGGDTELDKTLIEKIGDPLTHLVRNSMDHGIEKREVRLERGKNPVGTVRLNAFHDSGSVVIEVSDDGGGLNRERIVAKAIERGLIASREGLSDQQIYGLIFEPGFSTAEAVTNLSGRGVGMDVVKRNVSHLRGTIEIDSTPGVGTTMRIRLPLTLAIIEGFLVRVGAAAFVVPLDMVEECVDSEQAVDMLDSGQRFIDLRGQALPFIRLRDHFHLATNGSRRESIVVVRHGAQRAGLLVEELLGEHQTVIKPLARMFQNVRGLGGSTILGDGTVALIIEVGSLLESCKPGTGAQAA